MMSVEDVLWDVEVEDPYSSFINPKFLYYQFVTIRITFSQ